jgi:hypothetical protein
MSDAVLNNRELAAVIWLLVPLVLVLLIRDVRRAVPGLLRAALTPKIVVPVVVMLAYVTGLVLVMKHLGLWSTDLTKDMIVWVLGPALVLFARAGPAGATEHFFRRAVFDTIKFTVFVEFYLNLFVFGLWVELALVPMVTVLILLATFADTSPAKEQYRPVTALTDRLVVLIGLGLATYVTAHLVRDWPPSDAGHDLRALALPVYMTVGLLPYLYALSLWATYEVTSLRVDFATQDPHARRQAKMALITVLNVRVHLVGRFDYPWLRQLANAASPIEARNIVRRFKAAHPSTTTMRTDSNSSADLCSPSPRRSPPFLQTTENQRAP